MHDIIEFRCSDCGGPCNDFPNYSVNASFYDNGDNSKSTKRDNENTDDKDNKATKAELALEKAKECCKKTFVDEYRITHASIDINEHSEIIPIESKKFRDLIRSLRLRRKQTVVDTQTLKDALAVLSAEAILVAKKQLNSILGLHTISNGLNKLKQNGPMT